MSDLFTRICSGGGGREIHETFKGGGTKAIYVWKLLC